MSAMSAAPKNQPAIDWKAVAKSLSDSYSAVFQNTTLDNVRAPLALLAQYSEQLPTSWLTPGFIQILLKMSHEYQENLEVITSVFTLLSSWSRRLGTDKGPLINEQIANDVITLWKQSFEIYPVEEKTNIIHKEAWIGMVSLAGQQFGGDSGLIDAITSVVQLPTSFVAIGETLDAGVAHCLAQTSTLNALEVDHCQSLVDAWIMSAAKRSLDGIRSIITAMDHVLSVRGEQKPTSRANNDLEILFKLVIDTLSASHRDTEQHFASLSLLISLTRFLQFKKGATKVMRTIKLTAEETCVKYLNDAVHEALDLDQSSWYSFRQDVMGLFAGQCLPNMSHEVIQSIDTMALVQLLISCLLTSDRIWNQFLQLHDWTPKGAAIVDTMVNDPYFHEVGRISRAIARLLRSLIELESKEAMIIVQTTMDRLAGFTYNVLVQWERLFSQIQPTENEPDTNHASLWTVVKSILFSMTAITKSVAVDIQDGRGLVAVPGIAQDILAIFANLYFVSIKIGSTSNFKAYEETLTNTVAYLKHSDQQCQLNRFLSLAYREYAPSQFTTDNGQSMVLASLVQQARLTFFTNIIEQVMSDVDDAVLEQDILPVLYPLLETPLSDTMDLYESAHSAILSVFTAKKSVSRELAGIYATILIKRFPETLSLQQLRYAYRTMIQSLCEVDDALAWLTTGHLVNRIHALKSESEIPLRSQFAVALIDLIGPMSLGPFFGRLLKEIASLVKAQPTTGTRRAMLDMVYDAISGPSVSDMRRVEAVGWFLDLKQDIMAVANATTTEASPAVPPPPPPPPPTTTTTS